MLKCEEMKNMCFFIDIDGTITDEIKGKVVLDKSLVWGNPVLGCIRDVMVKEKNWDPKDAKKAIETYADKVIWWDYPDFITKFDLPVGKTWKVIQQWHQKYLFCYDDGVKMVKELARQARKLFVVSNNPFVGCLLKLERAGLGNIDGSGYFKKILGANSLRGQKCQRELWERAIIETGFNPKDIVTIGDNLKEDGEIPLSSGIGHAFIIQRDLSEKVVLEGQITLVKSAAYIPLLIQNF